MNYGWGNLFKDYWILLEGRRLRFSYFSALRLSANFILFINVFLLGKIIDFFTTWNSGDTLQPFFILTGSITVLSIFQVWFRFYSKVHMQTIAANMRKEARIQAMSHLLEANLKWHEQEDTGSKIHRINQGAENIFEGIRKFSNNGVNIIVGIAGSIIIFATLNWIFALFAVSYVIIYLSGERYFNKKLYYWEDQLNKVKEKVSGKLHESASNVLTIKALGLKESFKKSSKTQEDHYYKTWLSKRRVTEKKTTSIKMFSGLMQGLFILMTGYSFIAGEITLGFILVYINYFDKLKSSLHEISNNITHFIAVRAAIGRFTTFFGAASLTTAKGEKIREWKEVTFSEINFSYHRNQVIEDFNLKIKRGEKVGLVGRSGSGKSTLVKLLLNLYKPTSGSILVGDQPLGKIHPNSISKLISIVPQDSEMFNLTLLENITISGKRKGITSAISISQLNNVIKKLPLGFNTQLGEKGYKLSGGERQRVGIARAIYKDTPY